MNRLEDELKNALKRKEPAPDFVKRLFARIPVSPTPKSSWRRKLPSLFRPPKMRWIAVGVMTCLFVWIGIAQYHKYRKVKVEGEMAKTQVMLALHIACTKLNLAQKVVLEKDRREPLSQPRESQ